MRAEPLLPIEHLRFETAEEHVCRRVPIASPAQPAGEVRRALSGASFDTATHVAVCERERLVGIVRLEDLLAAGAEVPLGELMDPDPPVVAPGADQEVAAWRAVQHGESALAVVDGEGRFVGFVPPHRLLEVLLWEHEEDMARLGGFLRDTGTARSATREPVRRRLGHRIPWLLVGLAGALVAADIVAAFELQLEKTLALAYFLPGIVYLADAVGTQTETLVIRGLSVGVRIGETLRRELLTGLLIGVALALVFYPLGVLRWSEPEIALAVSLSLVAACFTATFVAMLLPWLLHRLGRDPAFGSGPLATVIQDLLSILLYLGISATVVNPTS